MRGSQFGGDALAVLDPPDGTNLYRYCGNDPINFADPSGLEEFRVGPGGTLTRRYSVLPRPGWGDYQLPGTRQTPGPGEWELGGSGASIDTRNGRRTGQQIWYPLDETAVSVVNEFRFKEEMARTENDLKDALANLHVPVSELEGGLGSNVWLVDGGFWVGRTYVQDVAVGRHRHRTGRVAIGVT